MAHNQSTRNSSTAFCVPPSRCAALAISVHVCGRILVADILELVLSWKAVPVIMEFGVPFIVLVGSLIMTLSWQGIDSPGSDRVYIIAGQVPRGTGCHFRLPLSLGWQRVRRCGR